MICTYKTAKIKGGGIRNKAFIRQNLFFSTISR